MQGQGPTSGYAYDWGWLIASEDFIAVDRIVSHALGYEVEELPHLKGALDLGVGPKSLDEIELIGATLSDLEATNFTKANLLPITFNPFRLAIGYFKHLRQMKT